MSYIDPVFVEFARTVAPAWGVSVRSLLASSGNSRAGCPAKGARYCTYALMLHHGYTVKEIAAHAGVEMETVRYGLLRAEEIEDGRFFLGGRRKHRTYVRGSLWMARHGSAGPRHKAPHRPPELADLDLRK